MWTAPVPEGEFWHDADLDLNRTRAPQDDREHRHALPGEGVGWGPPAAQELEVTICDLKMPNLFRVGSLTGPSTETRNRKILPTLVPAFEAVPPIWELRIGEYRVFYDVDEAEPAVYVWAIRRKPPHKTTEEII